MSFALPMVLMAFGCVSVDENASAARSALLSGATEPAVAWAEELATESHYSRRLGEVEAGRTRMLAGDYAAAGRWFRKAVDSAIDRSEREPVIKLGDVADTALAATITDDRTREYYLAPYELNLALEYAILCELFVGQREDALVDARLSAYVQDGLAKNYGADLERSSSSDGSVSSAGARICEEQFGSLEGMIASTRNSWENPVLWWLTGVLFEADGDLESAWQSYRKASALSPSNPVFRKDSSRGDHGHRLPSVGKSRLVVMLEDGIVPQRESFKVPVPIYTGMSIDIPRYADTAAYSPVSAAVAGDDGLVAASPALDIRSLAGRDLKERLPGVVFRNLTRAGLQAATQAVVNNNGNEYASLAVFVGNAVVSAVRRADTRSWVTLPDGQQVWEDCEMKPGDYRLGLTVGARSEQLPLTLAPGRTKLLWISHLGGRIRTVAVDL